AGAGRRAADGGALGVSGAEGARAATGLRHVARAGRDAADRERGREVVGRADVAQAVADLGNVAEVRSRAADSGALQIRRTRGGEPRARLGRVARAGRGTTHGARGRERVGRAVVADAVAALRDVARARRRPADVRALRVRRTARSTPGAALGQIAGAGGRTAHDDGRQEAVGRAVVADAVADLGDVAVAGRGAAAVRALQVLRAEGPQAVAGLGGVAGAGGGAAYLARSAQVAVGRAAGVGRAVRRPEIALLAEIGEAVAADERVGGDRHQEREDQHRAPEATPGQREQTGGRRRCQRRAAQQTLCPCWR